MAYDRNYLVELGWPIGTGQTDGHKRVAVIGINASIDTATVPEDLWHQGGVYPWLIAPTLLEIVSTNAGDAPAGAGIASVRVDGLDAGLLEQSQVVVLNGLTPVPIPVACLRINGCITLSKGSGAGYKATNLGDLIIRDLGGGTVRAVIPAGRGFASQAVWTCPANYTAQIVSTLASISRTGGGVVNYASLVNYSSPSASGVFRLPLEFGISSNTPYRHDAIPGIPVASGMDVALRCSQVSTNGLSIAGGFLILYKQLISP